MSRSTGDTSRDQRGITGLETAIILIAFVVVASVFAFTVLSTGIFASERSKETVFSGIEEAQSTLEPRGAVIAYRGLLTGGTSTVYKLSFVVSNAVAGEPVDLTPSYDTNDAANDPDIISGAKQVTVVSFTDKNQAFSDLPFSINYLGDNDGDHLLENNEKAEITVWLLDRVTGIAIGTAGSVAYMDGSGDGGGGGGITSSDTFLIASDEFTLQVQPANGAVLNIRRRLPTQLDTVMDLN